MHSPKRTSAGLLHNMSTTYSSTKSNRAPATGRAVANSVANAPKSASAPALERNAKSTTTDTAKTPNTAIANCIQHELRRYFDLLDGEEPSNVYHLVMRQAEHALIESVMQECGGNQSKATKWLGISRGNLRNKLADMGYD